VDKTNNLGGVVIEIADKKVTVASTFLENSPVFHV
jgi:hypothetical protein